MTSARSPRAPGTLAARRFATAVLERIRVGSLILIDDGGARTCTAQGRRLRPCTSARRGSGRCFSAAAAGLPSHTRRGLWDSPDLVALIRVARAQCRDARPRPRADRAAAGAVPARACVRDAQHAASQPQGHRCPLRPRQRPVLRRCSTRR